MVRDKSHIEQIERWAEYVRNDKTGSWKRQLNEFINAQFEMSERFYKRLAETPNGKQIILEMKMARANKTRLLKHKTL